MTRSQYASHSPARTDVLGVVAWIAALDACTRAVGDDAEGTGRVEVTGCVVVVVRVIVVGAGEVGRSIAENLEDSHDVVVIDTDDDVVEELTYSMDVLALQGDGTDLEMLREAGVEDADMLLACTDGDETNIVTCGAAKTVADTFTVCRVKRRNLLETWQHAAGAFGVDFMVSTDLLTAEAIFRISGVPGAHDADAFAGGLVRMVEFELEQNSPIAGETIAEADRYDSMTFAAIFRDDTLIVPGGGDVLRAGDRVVVIGSDESVKSFSREVVAETDDSDDVVILGGSDVGFQIARVFEEHGFSPRLIERDHDRAREIAEELPNTSVMESDVTDTEFLVREHVDEAHVVVAALGNDEQNLLASLLAERIGVRRTLAIVETAEYADLFEAVGVDAAINPREEVAEEIVQFTRAGGTEKVVMLEHDRGEVLEIEIDADSVLANRSIADAAADLPEGVVIGSITRDEQFVVPRGGTMVLPGDHVVVFVDVEVIDEVVELL